MAPLSMVRYEIHVIYQHCNTSTHLETMFNMKHKTTSSNQTPILLSYFRFEEI